MDRLVNVVIVRSDGQQFNIKNSYEILSMVGFGDLNVIQFTQPRAEGDGDISTGQRVPSRLVSINLICANRTLDHQIREVTNRFFNPNYTYKLYVTYNNVTRWLKARLNSKLLPTNNVYKEQVATLSFLCLDPYYHSVDAYDQDIATVDPTFGWPTYILEERSNKQTPAGISFGAYSFQRNVTIINDGDFPSWFTATIICNEDITDFKLIQDENTFVQIEGVMAKGTEAIIDMEEASLYLKTSEEEGFVRSDNRLSRDSVFFEIPVGESIIKYDATSGAESVAVKLSRYLNYSGI